MDKIKFFKFTGIVILAILWIVLTPGDAVPKVEILYIDKIVHFGMFFGLTLVFNIEYRVWKKNWAKTLYPCIIIAIFALSTEVMQLFAIKRSFDLKDWIMDVIGMLIAVGGVGIIKIYNMKFSKK